MARPQGLPSPLAGVTMPSLGAQRSRPRPHSRSRSRSRSDLAGLTGPWAPCYLFSECRRRRQVLRPRPALRVGGAPVVRRGRKPARKAAGEREAGGSLGDLFCPLFPFTALFCVVSVGIWGKSGGWRVAGPSLCLSPCSRVVQRGGGGGRRKVSVRVKQLLKVRIKFWRNLIIFDGTF